MRPIHDNSKRFSDEVRKSVEQTRPPPAPNKSMKDATFRPRLDVLPAAQRRLWPAPAEVPEPDEQPETA